MHSFLKTHIEPEKSLHEIKVGSYYVDILNDNGIYEVQTKHLYRLKRKLTYLLKEHKVTVVIPIITEKTLFWLNPETLEKENEKGRLSPKRETYYDMFSELYGIKELLNEENLFIHPIKVNIEEYRLLNGWSYDKKKGSVCHDRKPVKVCDELKINNCDDYKKLIPDTLEQRFSSKDFAKQAKTRVKNAQIALNILKHVNAIEQVSKQGNLLIYERMV